MVSKSISTSKKLSKVSDFDALLFTWLIPHCDDYGRMEAEPNLVKGTVVPLRKDGEKDVEKGLKNLGKSGLILLYEIDTDKYLEIVHWEEHQTFRSDRPRIMKFPPPPMAKQLGMTLDIPMDGGRHNSSEQVKLSQVKLINKEMLAALAQGFEIFYKAYPNKVAKQKALARWNKISPDAELQTKIMTALQNHKESEQWTKDDGKFIPHPATWLYQLRWEQVLPKAKPKEKKPYYKGDPMVEKNGKRYVIKNGVWLEYAGKKADEKDIEYK